jgi:RNA polymerase sigma-70 factor (ECF subfamily)
LRDVEGLSNADVAQTLRMGVANVKSRVHRARLFLQKRLAIYFSARRVEEGISPLPMSSAS